MKIVFIITRSDEIGGAQIHVRDITSQMVKDGHDVTVLVGGDGPLVGQLEKNRVKVNRIKNLIREISLVSDFKAYLQIKAELKVIQPDLVTTHSSKAGLLGRLAAKACGYPVIFTAHGWAFTDGVSPIKKIIYKQIEKVGAHFSDKIINVSEKDRQLAIDNHIGNPGLHVTIHNGIGELQSGKNVESKDLNKIIENRKVDAVSVDIKIRKKEPNTVINQAKTLNLVMVARFSVQKDHETLLYALSQLKNYNWYLRLIGIGPKLNEMKSLAKKLGIDSAVDFMGERFDVPEILEASDVFVLTTNWEGLPISIIEAMRAGLPVIASDVGGVNEQLNGRLSWGLVRQKDSEHVKEKLLEIMENEKKIIEFGRLSKTTYKKGYSFDNMYFKNIALYKQAEKTVKRKK